MPDSDIPKYLATSLTISPLCSMTRIDFHSSGYGPVFFNDRINFPEIMPSVKNEDLTPLAPLFPLNHASVIFSAKLG
ncbi:MAG: hypothetical protein KAT27_07395 [Desulfobacterales bacterium]|nr:hypothetical protein [Desulfobacterales bacterium]